MTIKKLTVSMPDSVKKGLEKMSVEVGMSQNQLFVIAAQSLLANYEAKGSFIFADLLNPEHRS
ncbi:hypothetical protein [Rossellomorea yichunensis]|uniref:hypothetical protein n=1 Tax=Rossellomorea yichunensis TaxID=3077331 RepID=UPI0028DF4896|nr:hypothetical protein [Rossellomorea sp. YC4-1]MDT9027465.1 hypothetical protein [Rossellomorea sp. YC4-1]